MKYFIYLIFVFYFFSLFQVFSLGSLGVTPVYLVLLGLYTYMITRFLLNSEKLEIQFNTLSITFLLFLAISLFSSIDPLLSGSSIRLTQYIKTTAHLNYLALFTFLCLAVSTKKDTWLTSIKIWLYISILINVFGIYQIAARAYDLPFAWIEITNISKSGRADFADSNISQLSLKFKNFYRATSIFYEPSALATFNLIILSMVFFSRLSTGYKIIKSKIMYSIIVVSSVIALFLTFSLTGAFGIILLLSVYMLISKKVNFKKIASIFFIVTILLLIADYFVVQYFDISVVELFYNRISGILGLTNKGMSGESFNTRFSNISESIDAWIMNPLFGAGMGQTYIVTDFSFSEFGILHVLIEMGIVGAFLFIALYFFSLLELVKYNGAIKNAETKYLLNVGIYLWVILFIINYITSNNIVTYTTWIFFGLIFAILNLARRELGEEFKTLRMWDGFKIKKPHLIGRADSK